MGWFWPQLALAAWTAQWTVLAETCPRLRHDGNHIFSLPALVDTPAYQPPEAHGLWEVRSSPGKGRGVFAVVDIPRGTRLLVEAPLFAVKPPPLVPGVGFSLSSIQPAVEAAVATLTAAQQAEFLSCHEVRFPGEEFDADNDDNDELNGARLMRILRSNAYTMHDGRIAIYPKVALINHDCQPNVLNVDSRGDDGENNGRRSVVATRDIAAGEEVLTTYVPLLANTATRRARLAQYGFHCECTACQRGEQSPSEESPDAERVRMGRTLSELDAAVREPDGGPWRQQQLTQMAAELATYVETQGFADYFVHTSRLAVEFGFRAGDEAAAVQWARRHLEHHQAVDKTTQTARDAEALLAFVEEAVRR